MVLKKDIAIGRSFWVVQVYALQLEESFQDESREVDVIIEGEVRAMSCLESG